MSKPDAAIKRSSVILPGGRALEFLQAGDPAGYPLVLHHGTPGEMNAFTDWDLVCREVGLRLISMSRPGYAESNRLPQRRVVHAATDVAAVLDSLGIDRFVTAGWSGGGPHALACAALLPERCAAAAGLASIGPSNEDDLDLLTGMGPENVAEFGAAAQGEAVLRQWMNDNATAFRSITGPELAAGLGGLVPEVDRQALTGDFADHGAAVFRRSMVNSFDGWIDDDLAFTQPWGFSLDQIRIPVTVWQGELDLMVPIAHGRWLARRIPHATSRILPDQGHISIVMNFRREILTDLLSKAQVT